MNTFLQLDKEEKTVIFDGGANIGDWTKAAVLELERNVRSLLRASIKNF